MLDKLSALIARFDEVEARLSAPDLYDDPAAAAKLLKEQRRLAPIVEVIRAREQALQTITDAQELMREDPEMRDFAQEEMNDAQSRAEQLEQELKILLLPRDPNDDKNIIVEIRGGAGGEESALFAQCMQKNAAGQPSSCPSMKPNLAAARKLSFKLQAMAHIPV